MSESSGPFCPKCDFDHDGGSGRCPQCGFFEEGALDAKADPKTAGEEAGETPAELSDLEAAELLGQVLAKEPAEQQADAPEKAGEVAALVAVGATEPASTEQEKNAAEDSGGSKGESTDTAPPAA